MSNLRRHSAESEALATNCLLRSTEHLLFTTLNEFDVGEWQNYVDIRGRRKCMAGFRLALVS